MLALLETCLSLTITDRLEYIDIIGINEEESHITFKFTWGLDGSGDYSNYHQLSKIGYTTKQVMSVCFALREVTIKDINGVKVGWNSSVAGAN